LNGKTGEPAWPRHPCAFIVEAADDICNALLDLEDAIRLGYIERNEKEGRAVRMPAGFGKMFHAIY
jgi:dGTPase